MPSDSRAPPRTAPDTVADAPDLVFYDGACGLCHRLVRFVLNRDPTGRFRYAPLGGTTFERLVPPGARDPLPDSVVVRTADGRMLVRSAAIIQIGERLGDPWRTLVAVVGLLPHWLLDAGYDAIARIRSRLFDRPEGVCPIIPPELTSRFLP
jgi:predicted DCC family thiol-disulfide oxidoreductase YuxK